MKITIVIHRQNEKVVNVTKYVDDSDIYETTYNTLIEHGIDNKIAIDCASWCETADYEDSYNMEDFDVYTDTDLW